METGPRFKVSSERLEKPVFEHTTPGLQGGQLNHYTTEASALESKQKFSHYKFTGIFSDTQGQLTPQSVVELG